MVKILVMRALTLCTLLMFQSCATTNTGKQHNNLSQKDTIKHSGEFIMMPEHIMASFHIDFTKNIILIQQKHTKTTISLQQIFDYTDYYAAPKGRILQQSRTKVIHISKNVFNHDNLIEVLLQATFVTKEDKTMPFVIDFLLNENGDVKILGSTYKKTGRGSNPVFAIIDNKTYYGIYDDRYIVGSFLQSHQRLNAIPKIMLSEFTNGTIVFQKQSWQYAKKQNIPIEKVIRTKQTHINKLIGHKNLFIEQNAQYFAKKIKMVATFNDRYYNPTGIRNLISDLDGCDSPKIIPVLIDYVYDERSIDLPGDDYGNTTVSYLALEALSQLFSKNPKFFIDYPEKYVDSKQTLLKWWNRKKHLYMTK